MYLFRSKLYTINNSSLINFIQTNYECNCTKKAKTSIRKIIRE